MKFDVLKDAEFNGNNYFASFLHVFILDLFWLRTSNGIFEKSTGLGAMLVA